MEKYNKWNVKFTPGAQKHIWTCRKKWISKREERPIETTQLKEQEKKGIAEKQSLKNFQDTNKK